MRALYEGDEIAPMETVLTIEGDYSLFAHLETVYLGCLARRSLIMRNVSEVVEAARGKPILFFPARHDHWLVQTGDGWAAHVAGAIGVSTDAQASWWGGRGVGTVPHGLIAAFGGDSVAAARAFADRFADEMNVTVLVDFENDSVRTAIEVADALGRPALGRAPRHLRAHGRQGTLGSDGRVHADRRQHRAGEAGARRARRGGARRVQIVVSGGFDAAKIRQFEARAAGGLLRRRLVAGARRERLHRRRGTSGGTPRRKGGGSIPVRTRGSSGSTETHRRCHPNWGSDQSRRPSYAFARR